MLKFRISLDEKPKTRKWKTKFVFNENVDFEIFVKEKFSEQCRWFNGIMQINCDPGTISDLLNKKDMYYFTSNSSQGKLFNQKKGETWELVQMGGSIIKTKKVLCFS